MKYKDIHYCMAMAFLLTLALAGPATSQCILANPSFELGPSGPSVFGGWEQFGAIGSVSDTTHGSQAARVSGPNTGDWDISAFWQSHDCLPGEQFEITGHVMHPSSNPLTGGCAAIVNIEWWNSGGTMIDYESFTVADATSPTDEYLDFSFVSTGAPAGTASPRTSRTWPAPCRLVTTIAICRPSSWPKKPTKPLLLTMPTRWR